jgi:hypothetical protein
LTCIACSSGYDASNSRLVFGEPFQVGETDLKILADDAVDVHEYLHQPDINGAGPCIPD